MLLFTCSTMDALIARLSYRDSELSDGLTSLPLSLSFIEKKNKHRQEGAGSPFRAACIF